jgi:hypothetical protein
VNSLGKGLVVVGIAIAILGALLLLGDRLPFKIGRLPGDIVWKRGNATFYVPVVTLLLLNLAIWIVMRLFNRN